MNSAHTNPTYQRAKRHVAWLLQDAEEDEQYEQASAGPAPAATAACT